MKKCRILLLLLLIFMSPAVSVQADSDITINTSSVDEDWDFTVTGVTYDRDTSGYGMIFNQYSAFLDKYRGNDIEVILPDKLDYNYDEYYYDNTGLSIRPGIAEAKLDNEINSSIFANTPVESLICSNYWMFNNGAFKDSAILSIRNDSKEGQMDFNEGAFLGCSSSKISISGRYYLNTGCFSGCTNLEELHLSGEVALEAGVFTDCPNLKRIIFDTGISVRGEEFFASGALGCPESTVLCCYGEDSIWQLRNTSKYEICRLDPYITYNKVKALYAGDKFNLNTVVHNADTVSVRYISENSKVATVDKSGMIKAKSSGDIIIKILVLTSDAIYTEEFDLEVYSLPNFSTKLEKGMYMDLTIYLAIESKGTSSVTYSSSNKSVCTVSSKGKVKAKKTGKAVITIKSSNGGTGKVKIKVVKKNKK